MSLLPQPKVDHLTIDAPVQVLADHRDELADSREVIAWVGQWVAPSVASERCDIRSFLWRKSDSKMEKPK